MFKADEKLDDDEKDSKPGLAILIGASKKKPSYDPGSKLDGEEPSSSDDSDGRYQEACEIMAKMINAGRVDAEKLGNCLREAFEALEEEPHEEVDHDAEEEE